MTKIRKINYLSISEESLRKLKKFYGRSPVAKEMVYYSLFFKLRDWNDLSRFEKNAVYKEMHDICPHIPLQQIQRDELKEMRQEEELLTENVNISNYDHLEYNLRTQFIYLERWHKRHNKLMPKEIKELISKYKII